MPKPYSGNTFENWLLQIAQMATMWVTPSSCTTWFRASMRGFAPLTRSSIRSSVSRPPPPPQQKVPSRIVSGAMSTKLLHTARMIARGISNCPPGTPPMRVARAMLQESWNVRVMWSFADLSNVSLPCCMRS